MRRPRGQGMTTKSSDVYDYYYENYLILYNLYGRGRPRISREQYEELDKELMQIVAQGEGAPLTRDHMARVHDIEYMLMDDIAEALLDRPSTAR
jgi:hypothetical protein